MIGGALSAEFYLNPPLFSQIMQEWQRSDSWLLRARYEKHKNMIHSQHTPYESKIVGAKHRFAHVVPWSEWKVQDRPPAGFVDEEDSGDGCAAEDVEVARMIAVVMRGASMVMAPFKRQREAHRKHILSVFQSMYPKGETLHAVEDLNAGARIENGAASAVNIILEAPRNVDHELDSGSSMRGVRQR